RVTVGVVGKRVPTVERIGGRQQLVRRVVAEARRVVAAERRVGGGGGGAAGECYAAFRCSDGAEVAREVVAPARAFRLSDDSIRVDLVPSLCDAAVELVVVEEGREVLVGVRGEDAP